MGRKLKINFLIKNINEWKKRIDNIFEKRVSKTKLRTINVRKKKEIVTRKAIKSTINVILAIKIRESPWRL